MLISAILLALIVLAAISLQKAYTHIPVHELKRRARRGDEFANLLYRAAAYGSSTQTLLWLIVGLSGAGFFVIIARSLPAWLALIISLILLWSGFAWLPNSSAGRVSLMLAKYLTGPLTWLLGHLYPLLNRVVTWFERFGHMNSHTGIYQKEDLLALLEKQKTQPDNHISHDELRIVEGALTFGAKLVGDVMTPRRAVKAVAATDAIGPHLMDELHASGHSRFPVYQDKPDNFVGMLYSRDLIDAQAGGQVRNLMKKHVYYVHEEQALGQVLQAFLKTKHHLFIVINAFEEVVGLITIEDVLEQIIGKPIMDEFDKYDDLRAVAALKAKAEHQQNKSTDKEAVSSDEPKVLE